ncbi:MAG TPA: hypothetical protein VIG73_09525 [Cerasibacillus sp.]|uniref:hypothetical protein n=1 Tax=Cerasibacillus sp. TaxID=2498711 RepID=UPI002F401ECA
MKRNNDHLNKVNMYSIHDLFKDKKLEIVAAALLLTGKLKVDSVEIFRDSPVVNVTLIGQYKTMNNNNKMVDFIDENGDMTLNEIVEAFNIISQRKG